MIEEVLERISSAGINGIRKAELKKTVGKNCDNILQNLMKKERIFVEKKGLAYFVWTRDNYILSKQNLTNPDSEFKTEFDMRLTESSTSIGWAPFSEIRKKICESKKISIENFYAMATNLVERHREKYEISSGGQEGIITRGLVHGFVRNV